VKPCQEVRQYGGLVECSGSGRGNRFLAQEIPRMNDIEGICAEGNLHAIEDIEKKLIRDNWAIPPGIELDCTVNGSNGGHEC
jgi:hypothetical protein